MEELNKLKKWAEDIAAEWDGNNGGSQEERAMQANDIVEKIDELKELLVGMENL